MTEEKVFWFDVAVDDMLGVQVLENVQLLEPSESCLNLDILQRTIWLMSNKELLRL